MDRNLALDFVRVTEAAALSASRWVGKGDPKKADEAAVNEMRHAFNSLDIDGTIVIGEGERDEAPMLYIDEKVGTGKGTKVDIAVDPLECTNSVAYGRMNAMSVMAASPRGKMLHAPDTYMMKIAVGPEAKGKVSLDATTSGGKFDICYNLESLAKALGKHVKDTTIMILERDRHKELIEDIRKCDARILLIPDGDISAAIAPSVPNPEVDMLVGIGAAPEGVITAAALSALGGYFEGRFKFRDKADEQRAEKMGVKKLDSVMKIKDMVDPNNSMFAATGITDGPFFKGVIFTKTGATTYSVVMRSKTKTVRFLESHHVFKDEPHYWEDQERKA